MTRVLEFSELEAIVNESIERKNPTYEELAHHVLLLTASIYYTNRYAKLTDGSAKADKNEVQSIIKGLTVVEELLKKQIGPK